jgi:predicted site-specific integrase-resolvase
MSDVISQADGRTGRVAAIYARVSSERQRQDETIQSQTVGLRELAAERGLLIEEDLVFEDEGFSGATLTRPALERLRDRAAEGAFEVLLGHAPDRLAPTRCCCSRSSLAVAWRCASPRSPSGARRRRASCCASSRG